MNQHAYKQYGSRLSRDSEDFFRKKRQRSEQLTPKQLWQKHRPLQGYLDSVTPNEKERLLNCSRKFVFNILVDRHEPHVKELRGNTIYPLGLQLD